MGAKPAARSGHSSLGTGWRVQRSVIRKASPALASGQHLSLSGVENRRSSGSLPVAFVSAAFAERASGRFGIALFPVPAHRTGQAHLAHPALGERFTVSPTESCVSE